MHILIITYNDYPVFEGLGVRIKNLARVIVEKGHTVTIFAPNIENRQPKVETFAGGRIVRANIYVPTFLRKNRVIARAWSMVIQTIVTPLVYWKYLRKNPVHLIMAEQVYAIPPALVIKTISRSKIYVDDIGTVSDILKDVGMTRISKLFTRFEKALFRRCDGFIYTSPVSFGYYQARGVEPTIYVPNGVDCDAFYPVASSHTETVVFFNGSTYSSQNTEAAVNFINIGKKVMESAAKDIRFRLVCWPEYNLPEAVRDTINAQHDWLSFEAGVEAIAQEIGKADIALLAYSPGHHLTGGVRLKALEYMACGKLIIATPEGVEGINGLIPNEHYILAGSVQEFPDIIFSIRRSPAEIKRISKNARQFVLDHYDWRATMTEFADRLLM